jgi:peptidase E
VSTHDDLPRSVTLLGPQRLQPTVGPTLSRLGVDGPVAAITAGWQEYEDEDDELLEHLGGKAFNLHLYRRAGQVFDSDPELAEVIHRRQQRLRDLQRLYRVRLDFALAAVRDLGRPRKIHKRLLDRSRAEAMEAVRRLDKAHQERLDQVHTGFERRWHPALREAVSTQRTEIAGLLEDCETVAIAGGHVAVLLNRLRLFEVGRMLAGKRVVAWSAGAMASACRVVLYHDMPPQGPGNSEVFETGLGLFPDVLPMPHARRRLRLNDSARVAELARRYAPSWCVAMDEESLLEWTQNRGWAVGKGNLCRLCQDGSVSEVGAC